MISLTARNMRLDGQGIQTVITCQFDAEGGSIGRDDGCDLTLPDRWISRVQARIVPAEGHYVIHNASVSNPMYVNGMELSPGSSQLIGDGDELRVADYVIMMAVDGARDASSAGALPAQSETSRPAPQAQLPAIDPGVQTDPLLAFGQAEPDVASPFADFLTEATAIASPIDQDGIAPAPKPESTGRSPSAAGTVSEPPDEVRPEAAVSVPSRSLPDVGMPHQQFLAETLRPPESLRNPVAAIPSGPSVNVVSDPGNPFGDLLAQALPVEPEGADAVPAHPDTIPASFNPFDLPEPNAAGARNRQPQWMPQPSVLDGDPFADLMGEPVESHMARVPVPVIAVQERHIIPGDINIFAMSGGVAQRNSSDPLTPLGRNAQGLVDVQPVKTIDSIYAPGAELATALVVNPIEEARGSGGVLRVGQDTDPLKLFANNGLGLDAQSDARRINAKSTSDHALELTSHFIPPAALPDSAFAQEQAANAGGGAIPVPDHPPANSPTPPTASGQETIPAFPVATVPPSFETIGPHPLYPGPLESSDGHARHQEPMDTKQVSGSMNVPVAHPLDERSLASTTTTAPADEKLSTDSKGLEAGCAEELMLAFRRGAGQQDCAAQSLTPELMETLGRMFQAVAQGPASLLAAQTAVGNEQSPAAATTTAPPAAADGGDMGARYREELMSAFKLGAGLQDWAAQSLTPELMRTIGRMLQSATQGTVSLLAARTTVKQEIHLSVTLINPKANNPLKFLPDGHTALLQMMGPEMPGFMAPIDAMEEAYKDLVTHQTAVAAGTQAAIEALFHRFAPDMIESRNPQSGMGEKMSQALHSARLWNVYKTQYRLIRDEVQDNFFRKLGVEFHDAYNREYDRDTPGRQ